MCKRVWRSLGVGWEGRKEARLKVFEMGMVGELQGGRRSWDLGSVLGLRLEVGNCCKIIHFTKQGLDFSMISKRYLELA